MPMTEGWNYNRASINTNAPTYAGVYGLYRGGEWIYFGEAENIRDRLIQHLDRDAQDNPAIVRSAPTGFAFEEWAGGKVARVERQNAWILANRNHPLCNRQLG